MASIELGEAGARLQGRGRDPTDVTIHFDDVIRHGERLLGRHFIAEHRIDEKIVGDLVPQRDRTRSQRALGIGHEGQRVVIDRDFLDRVERLVSGFGDDHGHRLADMAYLVGRQQHMAIDHDLAAAGRGELHVVAGRGHGAVRDRPQSVGSAIGTGEDAQDARHGAGFCRSDTADARMRIRRAQHHRIGLARDIDIVAEPASAGQQPIILRAADRAADCR